MISNAFKFSNQNTHVSVTGKIIGNIYMVEVTDHGRGMTDKQLGEIFPFIQHERKKYEQSGCGLGLITIKKMMDYYGGELKLSSVANEYTVCTVSLPIVCY